VGSAKNVSYFLMMTETTSEMSYFSPYKRDTIKKNSFFWDVAPWRYCVNQHEQVAADSVLVTLVPRSLIFVACPG
jgi:hypothetical protein